MKNENIEIELSSEVETQTKKRKVRIHKHPLVDKLTNNKARKAVRAYLKSKKGSNA